MKIPPDIQIKSTIKTGSVYYFKEESFSSNEPHYFIVINKNPLIDDQILLVCCSSQIENVKKRRRDLSETLVEIDREQYCEFTANKTIVDCNIIIKKRIEEIVDKLKKGQLKRKNEIDKSIIEEIRIAVCRSPLVEEWLKNKIS